MSTEYNSSRREALRRGLLGAAGLLLADYLRSPALAAAIPTVSPQTSAGGKPCPQVAGLIGPPNRVPDGTDVGPVHLIEVFGAGRKSLGKIKCR